MGCWRCAFSDPELARPFRTPAIHFVAPAGAASALVLMFGLPADSWLRLLGWLVVGLVIYFSYGRWHSRLGASLSPSSPD